MRVTTLIILLLLTVSCKKNIVTAQKKDNKESERGEINKNAIKNAIDFSIKVLEKDADGRPSLLKILVHHGDKNIDEITYKPNLWNGMDESNQVSRINYFNNSNIKEGIEDFHDFIIADFNFDKLEDFAILYDIGGNSGPLYSYFFQDKNGEFKEEKTFPLNEGPFPKEIDDKNKILLIKTIIGCCKVETTSFQLKNNSWTLLMKHEDPIK